MSDHKTNVTDWSERGRAKFYAPGRLPSNLRISEQPEHGHHHLIVQDRNYSSRPIQKQTEHRHHHSDKYDSARYSLEPVPSPLRILENEPRHSRAHDDNSKPRYHRHHQRWLFLWPFGKKNKNEVGIEPQTKEVNDSIEKALKFKSVSKSPSSPAFQAETAPVAKAAPKPEIEPVGQPKRKAVTTRAVQIQTIDQTAPSIPLSTEGVQTNDITLVYNPVTTGIQTVDEIPVKIPVTTEGIQTSVEQSVKVHVTTQGIQTVDETAVSVQSSEQTLRKQGTVTLDNNSVADDSSLHAQPTLSEDEIYTPERKDVTGVVSSLLDVKQKNDAKILKTNDCPFCRRGKFIPKTTWTGYLTAILCVLCLGPLWCRKACAVMQCNYCGATMDGS